MVFWNRPSAMEKVATFHVRVLVFCTQALAEPLGTASLRTDVES